MRRRTSRELVASIYPHPKSPYLEKKEERHPTEKRTKKEILKQRLDSWLAWMRCDPAASHLSHENLWPLRPTCRLLRFNQLTPRLRPPATTYPRSPSSH